MHYNCRRDNISAGIFEYGHTTIQLQEKKMTNQDLLQQNWARCLDLIRDNIGADQLQVWFASAEPVDFHDGHLVLRVSSAYYADLYDDHFGNILHCALDKAFGCRVSLEYEYNVIANDNASRVKVQSPERSKSLINPIARQMESGPVERRGQDFDSQLNPTLSFENYCVGKSNEVAYTIAEHIANHPEKQEFNPYFLYGNVGVGKTHLIQAIGIRIKERNPGARVLFMTMRQFQNMYQHVAMDSNGDIPQFINWFQSMDCILFDDLQEMTGAKTAATLFPIFNHLHQHNKKLIFTCDRPPMELDGLTDRLIDRFKWGITEPLPAPDLELRKKILHAKAARGGLEISEEIIDLIAESCTGSVRELEGIVIGLQLRCINANQPLSVEMAREVISHTVKTPVRRSVNFDMIVENTAEYFNLNPDNLFSKSRLRDIADARQIVMYLCSKHTDLSTPAIGAKLKREHSTVIYGIKAVKDRMSCSKETAAAIEAIEAVMLR